MDPDIPAGPWGPPTPFSKWSFFWAVLCLVIILGIRIFLRKKIQEKAKVEPEEIVKEQRRYKVENFEADSFGGAL